MNSDVEQPATGKTGMFAKGILVPEWLSCIFFALLLTVLQVLFVCFFEQPNNGFWANYKAQSLHWDANWYRSIVLRGYQLPAQIGDQSSMGFFPGYPVSALLIKTIFHTGVTFANVMAANIAGTAMWGYILLFFRKWNTPSVLRVLFCALIITHPAAFYLAKGYSESLFCASLLGLIYWTHTTYRYRWILIMISGVMLSATRFIGVPLCLYPMIYEVCAQCDRRQLSLRRFVMPIASSCTSLMGAGMFFVYSHVKFGMWNAYFSVQRNAWNTAINFQNLFDLRVLRMKVPDIASDPNPMAYNNYIVPLTLVFLGMMILTEWLLLPRRKQTKVFERLPIYSMAVLQLMLIIAVGRVAVDRINFIGALRYMLPVHIVMLVAAAHLLQSLHVRKITQYGIVILAIPVIGLAIYLQYVMLLKYNLSIWIV